ncbi:MAG: sulfite exporter TauE/SafE family protein [Methanomassiliicoccales archaeon]|nr:MAG: sulfite exporter TauE/SafE family protein [Methanomassiliicoccales archaeon]
MSEFTGALISLMAFAFIIGIVRGAAVCTFLCGPSLLGYTMSEGRNWRKGASYAIKFNIGRIALITAVGAILGYSIGFVAGDGLNLSLATMMLIGYLLIGIYSVIIGAVLYRRARKRQLDPNCDCSPHFKMVARLKEKYPRLFANETMALIMLGLLMGVVCLVEITLFDAVILASAAAMFGAEFGIATALTGALTMFVFGVGSAIPIIVINTSAGYASSRLSPQTINKHAGIIAVALITMGIIIILFRGCALVGLLANAG